MLEQPIGLRSETQTLGVSLNFEVIVLLFTSDHELLGVSISTGEVDFLDASKIRSQGSFASYCCLLGDD